MFSHVSVCVSIPICVGGVTPSGWCGGGYPILNDRGYTILYNGDFPSFLTGGYPHPFWWGIPPSGWWGYPGVPITPLGLDGVPFHQDWMEYPPSWLDGVPPIMTGWSIPPPPIMTGWSISIRTVQCTPSPFNSRTGWGNAPLPPPPPPPPSGDRVAKRALARRQTLSLLRSRRRTFLLFFTGPFSGHKRRKDLQRWTNSHQYSVT